MELCSVTISTKDFLGGDLVEAAIVLAPAEKTIRASGADIAVPTAVTVTTDTNGDAIVDLLRSATYELSITPKNWKTAGRGFKATFATPAAATANISALIGEVATDTSFQDNVLAAVQSVIVGGTNVTVTSVNGNVVISSVDVSGGSSGTGISSASYDAATGVLTLTMTDLSTFSTGDLRGADGTDGTNGTNGASAYQIAVANGFVGTEAAWLASLVGVAGNDGIDGANGQSISITVAADQAAFDAYVPANIFDWVILNA